MPSYREYQIEPKTVWNANEKREEQTNIDS